MQQETPADILDLVGPHYSFIARVVDEAWSIWTDCQILIAQRVPQYSARNRSIGSGMNDILRALFKERLADQEPIKYVEQANLFFIVIQEKVLIRFNLMDPSGMTIHTDTEQAKKYRTNELVIEGFEPKEYLYGGYSLDSSKSQIINFMILKREHDQTPVWILDRHNQVYQQTDIEFTTPARSVSISPGLPAAKRASAKKSLTGIEQERPKTGTDNG